MPEPQDTTQIQGLPPGAILKPIQTQTPDTSSIEGLPAGAVLKPISQPMVTNSVGETMPADVAVRHAKTREGKSLSTPEVTGPWASTAKIGNFVEDAVTGVGKEGLKTVQGVTALANKALPAGMRIPTLGATAETETHGIAEGVGGLGENIVEFMSGEELLSGLSKVAKLEKLAQASPTIANLVSKSP